MTRIPFRPRRKTRSEHPLAKRRRGTVILFTMICLLLVSLLGASLVKLALAQRRQMRREQWQVQAAWLAESAVDRAAARLAVDADYSGETWVVEPSEGGISSAAKVQIAVKHDAKRAGRFLVEVTADYPDHRDQRARVRKQTVITPRFKRETPSRRAGR